MLNSGFIKYSITIDKVFVTRVQFTDINLPQWYDINKSWLQSAFILIWYSKKLSKWNAKIIAFYNDVSFFVFLWFFVFLFFFLVLFLFFVFVFFFSVFFLLFLFCNIFKNRMVISIFNKFNYIYVWNLNPIIFEFEIWDDIFFLFYPKLEPIYLISSVA